MGRQPPAFFLFCRYNLTIKTNFLVKTDIMHKLQKVISGVLFLTAPASSMASLYLVGPGAPAGMNTGNPIELTDIGGNTYVTVCYLDNNGGRSFRVQEGADYGFYGPQDDGAVISNNSPAGVVQSSNFFSVAYPGIYYIEADMGSHSVKINRMSDIYPVGNIRDHVWDVGTSVPLHIENEGEEASAVYSGLVDFETGEFKIAVDPGNGKGFDGRFFLFKADKSAFTTSSEGDSKWTIGWPDMADHSNDPDITPGLFRVSVNAVTKAVAFFRMAGSVRIAGPGALASWADVDTNPSLSPEGNGVFSAKHIFFTPSGEFKVVVDGHYYGSDTWNKATVTDGSLTYLRPVADGADLKVASPGFRSVAVAPSSAGDGTLSLWVSAPESVLVEGVCMMEFDEASGSYRNTTGSLSWLPASTPFDFKVDGDVMASPSTGAAGWYVPSVTVGDGGVSYNLAYREAAIEGESAGRVVMEPHEAADGFFLRNHMYIDGGQTLTPTVGDRRGEGVAVNASGFYNVTLALDADGRPRLTLAGPVEVHMPLTESDFENGRVHYFIVGQRMGAWRLQPEWELLPAADGSYTLPGRLLYNGYVMVGAVDNYEDYITQTYRAYSYTDTGAPTVVDPRNGGEDANREFALTRVYPGGENGRNDGKFTGTRYNDLLRTAAYRQHGGWEQLANNALNVLDPQGFGDQEHIQSMPSRVTEIRLLTDGDGQPVHLAFNGLNTTPLEVARLRTFSLVGGGILNSKVVYDDAVSTSPLNHQQGYSGNGWSEAWIQYDAKAKPYVDAFGEYIYQTSFTRDWLRAHPSYFNFGDDFEYTSNNITFNYAPERTHADQFGQIDVTEDDFTRREVLCTYYNCPDESYLRNNIPAVQNLDDCMTVAAADRACFVVNDIWMEGMFKVWSGWGGSATNCEYDDNGTTHTRWFLSNAGHGAWRDDRAAFYSAGEIMAYTLFEDMDAANFGIGFGAVGENNEKLTAEGSILPQYRGEPERKFFKRVEIWFNLNHGFAYKGDQGASFLLFYQEKGGPNITNEKHDDNHLKYSFNIPLVNNMSDETEQAEFGNVIYYEIHRIRINDDGSEDAPVFVESAETDVPRKDFVYTGVLDPKRLSPGRYRYQITTIRRNTPGHRQTAKSNIVPITAEYYDPTGIEEVGMASGADNWLKAGATADGRLDVSASGEIGRLMLFSVSGVKVAEAQLNGTAGQMDISALPAGVYIARNNNASARFIKR